MLLFNDLETTGLKAATESILEVAVILVNDKFQEVARFERVIQYKYASLITDMLASNMTAQQIAQNTRIAPRVIEMHRDNGLWAACAGPSAVSLSVADRELAALIKTHCKDLYTDGLVGNENKEGPQLAGNTISFDRSFLEPYMPQTFKHLHYRNLDCSSINELARRVWPAVFEQRPRQDAAKHRAMEDTEQSLWLAKYYASRLAPADLVATNPGPSSAFSVK